MVSDGISTQRAMIPGRNSSILHAGIEYHVQTEEGLIAEYLRRRTRRLRQPRSP